MDRGDRMHLLVALAAVPSPAEAAYPGSNGKVAFVRANQIWTVNADGTGEVQLTSAAAPSFDPQWSPNGRASSTRADRPSRKSGS